MDKSIEKEFKVKKEPKTKIGKFWKWLWHSDSFLSWIVALIFAFIIVKFIFFPVFGLAAGWSWSDVWSGKALPLVVVESGSMSHPQAGFFGNTFSTTGSFNSFWNQQGEWYSQVNISQKEFSKFPFRTGMEKGDIIVVWRRGDIETGDVIIFHANQAHPIIHRIINITTINNQLFYSTKGDNNPAQLDIEKSIPANSIIGKSVFKIPKLGWLKLAFVKIFSIF